MITITITISISLVLIIIRQNFVGFIIHSGFIIHRGFIGIHSAGRARMRSASGRLSLVRTNNLIKYSTLPCMCVNK